MHRPGVELATSRAQVRRRTTTPPSHQCSTRVPTSCTEDTAISTHGKNAVSFPVAEHVSELFCRHEEADTRLLFHASQCNRHGYKVMVGLHVTDRPTDVVVIAIAVTSVLRDCETKIWIVSVTVSPSYGAKQRYISCHAIAAELGKDASWGLFLPCDAMRCTVLVIVILSGCLSHSCTVSTWFDLRS